MRKLVLLGLGLLAASTLLGPSAHAQVLTEGGSDSVTSLAGYSGKASASGFHATYNPEGLLPVSSPVDLGVPDALATLASGPTTFARASIADPGDIIANPDAVLALLSPDYPAGTVPPYPYRISANSGTGEPRATSAPAPGLNAAVEARPDGSSARAATPEFVAPAVATIGSVTSAAETIVEDSQVTAHARTEASRFQLLDLLKVESLVTDVKAVSDGGQTKLTGGTTIAGATFMDRPVTIDASGVHLDPKAEPMPVLDGLTGSLDDVLQRAGIKVTLLGPVDLGGKQSGVLASTGLRIDLELSNKTLPILGQLTKAVPSFDNPIPGAPLGLSDVLQVAKARHLVSIEVGKGAVSLTAHKATPIADVALDTGGFPDSSLGLGDVSLPATEVPSVGAPASITPAATEKAPAASIGAGIGALALLALLGQPLLGERLARGAAALLATDQAETCLREER
jgi:hypothetical protein